MTDFIQPLELKTWMVPVLSGTPEIFTVIALLFISGMAGFFRMSTLGMVFMLVIFFMMFAGVIQSSLLVLIIILGGLIVGFVISNIFAR